MPVHVFYRSRQKCSLLDTDEDEEPLKCHLENLSVERAKVCPNKDKIADLMQVTFTQRRKEIEEGMHVVEILKKYPVLEEVDVVCDDCNA